MSILELLQRDLKDLTFIVEHSKNKDSVDNVLRTLSLVKEKIAALNSKQPE